jgi:alpha-ketoglutarate-dependent taurine dioxygenase
MISKHSEFRKPATASQYISGNLKLYFAKMAIQSKITVQPITPPPGFNYNIGAELRNADLENLSDADFEVIHHALYTHQVILFKGQQTLSPKAQYELTQRFDPAAQTYGHGKTLDAKRSILHPDLKTIPHQPQVQVIGNGPVAEFQGLKNITLKHPHHRTFHRDVIPDDEDRDFTRFFRWHIDAALYDLHPPRVTSLMAVSVPKSPSQTLRYDDASGDNISPVPRGSTVFASSYTMYDLLSEEDKEFVRTTRVQYAAHPYIWMSQARSKTDGLGLVSEGKELPRSELPEIDEDKVQILPMCWRNPVTGKLALQIHPSAVEKLHLKDGTEIEDLEEVREIVHRFQRPGIAPELVFAVDWEDGDLALFNNHGVLHSVTGSFRPEEVRIFRQCNLAASEGPLAPLVEATA